MAEATQRQISYGDDSPVNDAILRTWEIPAWRYNTNPTTRAMGLTGWRLTVAGHPGTWVAEYGTGGSPGSPVPDGFVVACIDYDNIGGLAATPSDTTGAWGYATPTGVPATDMATALAAAKLTPFKTLERAGQLLPRFGNNATLVALIKGRTSAATYKLIGGATDATFAWRNWLTGYRAIVIRGTTDFSNSATDKILCDYRVASGTNAAGYNAIGGSTTSSLVCQLQGGGAPGFTAESAGLSPLLGLRIRFTSGALLNQVAMIHQVTGTNTLVPDTNFTGVPGVTDNFVIESEGVVVGSLTFTHGANGTDSMAGIRSTSTATQTISGNGTGSLRFAGVSTAGSLNFSGQNNVTALRTYVDEVGSLATSGIGIKADSVIVFTRVAAVTLTSSAWLSPTIGQQLSALASVGTFSVGAGCVTVQGINRATQGIASDTIGNSGSSTIRPLRVTGALCEVGNPLRGALLLTGKGANVIGVDVSNSQASAISFQNSASIAGARGAAYIVNLLTGSANKQFAATFHSAGWVNDGISVAWDTAAGTNTITCDGTRSATYPQTIGTLYDFELSSTTFADRNDLFLGRISGLGVTIYGTLYVGTASQTADSLRFVQYHGAGAQCATPGYPVSPTVPIYARRIVRSSGTTNGVTPAQSNSVANATGVLGVAQSGSRENHGVIVAVDGITWVEFETGTVPTPGQPVYLSALGGTDIGKATGVAPSLPVRIGVLIAAANDLPGVAAAIGAGWGLIRLDGSLTTDLSRGYVLVDRDQTNLFPNSQNLGALTTGLLKGTVSGSISTISTAAAGTDYVVSVSGTAPISVSGASGVRTVTHDTSGASAGTYTNTTVTVNATGHITSISSGTAPVISIVAGTNVTVSGTTTVTVNAVTGMTTGSILFIGASSVVSQDNANFFWDDLNNRVGIGNASPNVTLDIQNATSAQIRVGYPVLFTGLTEYCYDIGRIAGGADDGLLRFYGNSATQYGFLFTGATGGDYLRIAHGGATTIANLSGATATLVSASTAGLLGRATAGTDYVVSVAGTAPISVSGAGGVRTVSHDTSGASAGTHTYATVTVNVTGHVTSVSSGTAPVTGPAGSNTQIQHNNSGSFGASSAHTYDTTNGVMIVGKRHQTATGANVASANTLTLGTDGNHFTITGTTTIKGITTANWQSGSRVSLYLSGAATINNADASPGGGAVAIVLAGSVNRKGPCTITLVYDGTYWREPYDADVTITREYQYVFAGYSNSYTGTTYITTNTADAGTFTGGPLGAWYNSTFVSTGIQLKFYIAQAAYISGTFTVNVYKNNSSTLTSAITINSGDSGTSKDSGLLSLSLDGSTDTWGLALVNNTAISGPLWISGVAILSS